MSAPTRKRKCLHWHCRYHKWQPITLQQSPSSAIYDTRNFTKKQGCAIKCKPRERRLSLHNNNPFSLHCSLFSFTTISQHYFYISIVGMNSLLFNFGTLYHTLANLLRCPRVQLQSATFEEALSPFTISHFHYILSWHKLKVPPQNPKSLHRISSP